MAVMTGRSLRQLPLGSGGLAHQARHWGTHTQILCGPPRRACGSVVVIQLDCPCIVIWISVGIIPKIGETGHNKIQADQGTTERHKTLFISALGLLVLLTFGLQVHVAGDHPSLCPPLFFGRSLKRGSVSSICSMSGAGSISRAGTVLWKDKPPSRESGP